MWKLRVNKIFLGSVFYKESESGLACTENASGILGLGGWNNFFPKALAFRWESLIENEFFLSFFFTRNPNPGWPVQKNHAEHSAWVLEIYFPKRKVRELVSSGLVSKNDQFTNWSGKATSSRTGQEKRPVHELVRNSYQFTNWSRKAISSRTRPEKSPVLTSSFPVWKLGVKLFIWTLFFMRNRIPSSLARKFALFSSACKGVCEKLINESSYAKAHAQGLVRKVGRFRIRSGLYWFPIGNG